MLEDILRDTPVYKEVLAEGMQKGLEQGQRRNVRHYWILFKSVFPQLHVWQNNKQIPSKPQKC